MARKITVISTKGGSGKTTLTGNLGAALAAIGQRVLLIDTDVQQSLSTMFNFSHEAPNGLREMLFSASSEDCISTTVYKNLDMVINNDRDEEAKTFVSKSPVTRMVYLAAALKELDPLYDFILIDTVGTVEMGGYQEMAVRASDQCITPLSGNWISAKELPNTIDLLQLLEPAPGVGLVNPIPALTVLMWGIKRTNSNKTVVKAVADQTGEIFREFFKRANGKLHILNTIIGLWGAMERKSSIVKFR